MFRQTYQMIEYNSLRIAINLITVFITFKVTEFVNLILISYKQLIYNMVQKYNQVVNAYVLFVLEGIVQNDRFWV